MAFAPRERFAWRLRSRTLPLGERTLVMAIVNLTPDSFAGDGLLHDGDSVLSGHASQARAVAAALQPLDAGPDIHDLGAE